MTESLTDEPEYFFVAQTKEEAARSISHALGYLRLEADSIGLRDVGELIEQARVTVNRYRSDGSAQ